MNPRLAELVELARDQALPADADRELAALLADPEARAEAVRQWRAGLLASALHARPAEDISVLVRCVAASRASQVYRRVRSRFRQRRRSLLGVGLLAACLLVATGVLASQVLPVPWAAQPSASLAGATAGVRLLRQGQAVGVQAGMPLQAGDEISLAADAPAPTGFGYADRSRIGLQAGARIRLIGTAGAKSLALEEGRMHGWFAPQPPDARVVIDTPHSRLLVVGTEFDLAVGPDRSRLEVQHGLVRFTDLGTGTTVAVGAGSDAETWAPRAPVFQADFRGPQGGTGGPADLVSRGGTGRLTGGASITFAETPPILGDGSHLHAVVQTGSDRNLPLVEFAPAGPGNALACLHHGSVVRPERTCTVLDGGFDVFVRLAARDASDLGSGPGRSGAWFQPFRINTVGSNGGMELVLQGLVSGAVRFYVGGSDGAIHDLRVLRGMGAAYGKQWGAYLDSAPDVLNAAGAILHVAITLSTSDAGLIRARLFVAQGAVPIDTRATTHLASELSFTLDAAVLGLQPLPSGPWTLRGVFGPDAAGTTIDYALLRLYDADPGVFPLP